MPKLPNAQISKHEPQGESLCFKGNLVQSTLKEISPMLCSFTIFYVLETRISIRTANSPNKSVDVFELPNSPLVRPLVNLSNADSNGCALSANTVRIADT